MRSVTPYNLTAMPGRSKAQAEKHQGQGASKILNSLLETMEDLTRLAGG